MRSVLQREHQLLNSWYEEQVRMAENGKRFCYVRYAVWVIALFFVLTCLYFKKKVHVDFLCIVGMLSKMKGPLSRSESETLAWYAHIWNPSNSFAVAGYITFISCLKDWLLMEILIRSVFWNMGKLKENWKTASYHFIHKLFTSVLFT